MEGRAPKGVSLHVGVNELDPAHYRDGGGQPWTGELYGCENDADGMAQLATQQGFEVRGVLKTADATSAAVTDTVRAIAKELEPGDMFLLTYSGHGGQIANLDAAGDPESDELDETWCLYDRQLLDDELFALFGTFRPGVRIVVVSDSCHSGTVTRGSPRFVAVDARPKLLPTEVAIATERANKHTYADVQARARPARRRTGMAATVVLLAGCRDDECSLDGPFNGAFTSALLHAWNAPGARRSLRHLLDEATAGIPPDYRQHPSYTIYAFDVARALAI